MVSAPIRLPSLTNVQRRWYKHIASYQSGTKQPTSSLSSLVTYAGSEFSSLPGDPLKAYTSYGPEKSEATLNPKDAPKAAAEEEEEDDDLFGSDDESEDEETKKKREENLAAYKKKKEGKTKPAAKSIVTLDVKPWGMCPVPTNVGPFDYTNSHFAIVRRRDRHEAARREHAKN